ncbi:MAG: type IV secretion system protein VirB9 [Candidatus Tokpelaia sp. JSC188]|nr:MAG: type IV secretion system protein VirB9 [Candidatus Tokpelaia sp. JSC188]
MAGIRVGRLIMWINAKHLFLFFLPFAIVTTPTFALEFPTKSSFDHRIRYIDYNPANVVQIDTVLGVATHIELEEGEKYVTHVFGDSDSYAFTHKENHLFLKPKADQANTNLVVVTDRRSYKFRLEFKPTRTNATYEVSFHYPDIQTRQEKEKREAAKVDAAFHSASEITNLRYSMSGDLDIAPINAWDNGRFTFFKFTANADMPAIYMVDPEGMESLLNTTTKGASNNILIVQKVYKKFILRLGKRALAVFNDAYDAQGIDNTTGTVSSTVRRVFKGEGNAKAKEKR